MLEPWAWDHHAWKKRPIWWLWERRFLRRAALLHATAESEVLGLRALGLRNPVAVIPPGVNQALNTGRQPADPIPNRRAPSCFSCLEFTQEGAVEPGEGVEQGSL